MRLILLTLFAPAKAAQQIKSSPHWVMAFLCLSMISVMTYALIHPYLVQATLTHLPSTAIDADRQLVAQSLELELPAKLAFLPVRLFAGWGSFSLALLYASRAFAPREPIRFGQILSIEVHAEVTSVLATLVMLALTLSSVDEKLANLPLSLPGLVQQRQDFVINSLLRTLNIFTLWYIVLLTVGVSALCKLGKLKSLLIVLLVWTFSTMLNIGAMKLMNDELHFLL